MNLYFWWIDFKLMSSKCLCCVIKQIRQMSSLYLALYVKHHPFALLYMMFDRFVQGPHIHSSKAVYQSSCCEMAAQKSYNYH